MAGKNRKFWPHHVLKSGFLMLIVLGIIIVLANKYQLPVFSALHPEIVPLADDGMYIPQPEWFFLFLWQPFWYLTGQLKGYMYIFTFILPIGFGLLLLMIPLVFGKRVKWSLLKNIAITAPVVAIILFIASMTLNAGYGFKAYGCLACHNKYMGVRQASPPMDIAKYYKEERQRQIMSGKYTAGKREGANASLSVGGVESYKDANWQLRHGYEPTFTW